MSQAPQVGRNAWNNALGRARVTSQRIHKVLEIFMDTNPGPETRAVLITKIALALMELGGVLDELEQIGRQAKKERV